MGRPFSIHARKILNIPVVLGPEFNARIMGDPDNGAKTEFAFVGETPSEQDEVRVRVLRYVRQELNAELNASGLRACRLVQSRQGRPKSLAGFPLHLSTFGS